ncbi:MAG: trans-sialidase [Nitrosopumilus sp.]
MAEKRKASTKKDLETKIAELEAKLSKLSDQLESKPAPKPAETKPAETKPQEAPKPAETKPAEAPKPEEAPKPAETEAQPPATFNEALENAYYTAPMTSFHDYRAKVTGYSPAPNRYFVRLHAPVGTVPTSNWNQQKTTLTGYTQPSNQYFATRQRMAHSPPGKTFGTFSGVKASVEGVEIKEVAQAPPPEAAKAPEGKLPKETEIAQRNEGKSKAQLLEEYENEYLQRIEQNKIAAEKAYQEQLAAESARRASSNQGSLPKGFEPTPAPEPEAPKTSKGTLPKGF